MVTVLSVHAYHPVSFHKKMLLSLLNSEDGVSDMVIIKSGRPGGLILFQDLLS